jgi:large subunit ribosomal protein L4
MSTIQVYSAAGERAGELTLDDAALELARGAQAVKESVVARQRRHRAGTAAVLAKGEVAGSNKKPWRQKGTGRARAGFRQSPIWRGGGVVHGPGGRSYDVKVNRKVARLAFRRALSERVAAGAVRVIESIELPEAKTRHAAALLRKMGVTGSCLIVEDRVSAALARAARNLPKVEVVKAADVDVYSLLRFRTLVATRAGWAALAARLAKGAEVAA